MTNKQPLMQEQKPVEPAWHGRNTTANSGSLRRICDPCLVPDAHASCLDTCSQCENTSGQVIALAGYVHLSDGYVAVRVTAIFPQQSSAR